MPQRTPRVILAIRHYYPDGGGAEVSAHRLAWGLGQRGVHVEVLTGRYRGRPWHEVVDGVSVRRLYVAGHIPILHELCFLASFAWQLVRRQHHYDVIHVFQTQLAAFVAVLVAKRLGKRVVTSSRGGGKTGDVAMWSHIPGGKCMLGFVGQHADAATGVSTDVVAELQRAGFDPARTWFVPNGVAVSLADEGGKSRCRNLLGLPRDCFIAVFVGRLSHEKGLDVVLDAWQVVVASHPASKLVLVGDGPDRGLLKAKSLAAGLAQSVVFSGKVKTVESYLCAADIFVLPSFTEGMSNALLEAMAVALPVIASRVSGTVDVVQHEENGLLFEVGNVEELAERIISLIESPGQRTRLGAKGRTTIERHFSMDAMVDRYVSLYQSVMGGITMGKQKD